MVAEDVGSDERVELSARFRPVPAAAADARRFLRKALADLDSGGIGEDLADNVVMAANELVTNAVLHARTDFTVRVRSTAAWVRIEVADHNTCMPQACLAPADATSGRGLAIVDGSGLRWGADRQPGGKTVWVQGRRP